MKIYQVCEEGMYGPLDDEYFDSLEKAEKRFTEFIEEKKKDEDTLTDDQYCDEGYGEKNFTELVYAIPQKNNKRYIRNLSYGYGNDVSNENGTEFYSYISSIVLYEIDVK